MAHRVDLRDLPSRSAAQGSTIPIRVTDTDNGRGNILRGWGALSEQEILQAHEKHLGQPREKFGAYRYGLSDFSDVTSIDISTAGVRAVSQLCVGAARKNPDPVIAVVGSDDLVFGLARMHQALARDAHWDIAVFRERSEAVSWLRQRVRERFDMDVLKDDEIEAVFSS